MDKVIAVVGPTASGKSALAIELARALDGEIISADSMQVYQQMDIGTAKATPFQQKQAVHHLIDVQPYDHPWNVKMFQQACRACIADITARGKVPILCGGTGLYVKAALYDYEFSEEQEDAGLKAELEQMSNAQLAALLEEKDPAALEKIHPNNRKRLLRAAMMAHSNTKKSQREADQKHAPVYDLYLVGLCDQRQREVARINERVDEMFDQGLVQEVERLFSSPESWDFTSFQGIGYKEFIDYLKGEKSLAQVKEEIKVHTRQYAKRQMTWFRNQMPVHWYTVGDTQKVLKEVEDWYE